MSSLVDASDDVRREENIKALVANNLAVKRSSILPKYLRIKEGEQNLRKPFICPVRRTSQSSADLRRRLAARRLFVPWTTKQPFRLSLTPEPRSESAASDAESSSEQDDPDPSPTQEKSPELPVVDVCPSSRREVERVEVDPMLTAFLRPHQREGVQFMFECVTGLRPFDGRGCILADDMGLGKTLQGISLMWTLLQQGAEVLGGQPIARRAIVVCPTSLVSNWEQECNKWLKGRASVLALSDSSRERVVSELKEFLSRRNPYQILVISYETFRIHAKRFRGDDSCDVLLCDEAHRLKNDATLTNKALAGLKCQRRVLLSGTPMQNHLDEFYAMVNFCNPGVLGSQRYFHKYFEIPILEGREPDADAETVQHGQERSEELSSLVNDFILRRTNDLLSQHLPPKVIEIVCCHLTPLQKGLYKAFLASTAAQRLVNGNAKGVLEAVTFLKKLCNHPMLIYDQLHGNTEKKGTMNGFDNCKDLLPAGTYGRSAESMPEGWIEHSGKMGLLAKMLAKLRHETSDRIVIVSNYTKTLDLISVHCQEQRYPVIRLDGGVSIKKRQEMVLQFNCPKNDEFAFLLSSKAGGCGLNLIGANRLVLFDPDWNPATDKQAAARVWRDGQKKFVYVYRFLSTGTIEEKVFQRQLSKEGLQGLVNKSGKAAASALSAEDLKDLMSYQEDTMSDTWESVCLSPEHHDSETTKPVFKEQTGKPAEDDLLNWSHHPEVDSINDAVLKDAGDGTVSFVFACDVEGKAIEPQSEPTEKENRLEGSENRRHTATGLSRPSSDRLKGGRLSAKLMDRMSVQAPLMRRSCSGLGKRKTGSSEAPVLVSREAPQSTFRKEYEIIVIDE